MKNSFIRALSSATLLLFLMPQAKPQPFNPLLAAMLQDTFNYYFSFASNMKGMTSSVYLPGQGIWQAAGGVSYAGHPTTLDMEFGIASNTKLFTSTAMLILQEDGILSLNDPISQWLPNLNPSINPNITIRQLLNHKSGIPEVIFYSPYLDSIKNNPTTVFTPEHVVSWVHSSDFPAGTSWNYSNTNYVLAGMIVKNATGFHISKIIRDSILLPLNLTGTFYDVEEPEIGTVTHRWWNGITGATITDYNAVSRVSLNTAGGPAGALFSNASDMAQWYHALFSGQVLNASSLAELTTFVATNSPIQQYGLGLFRETTQGLTYWGHGGDTWGYKSKMIYDSCMASVVCALSNSYPNGMTSIPFLLYRVIKNHVPACPGAITGPTLVSAGQNNVTYTTTSVANATSFVWTLPNGATGTSSTNSITVNFGSSAVSGNITVRGNSQYGVGNVASLYVNVCALEPTVTSTNVSCNGGNNGSATILVAGGTAPYSYLWSNGSSSATISSLAAGVYTCSVTDVNGCSKTASVVITQPAALALSATASTTGCYGSAAGSITISATGGTSPYSFQWNNGSTATTLAGLAAGTYSATVTDTNGCTATVSKTITLPAAALVANAGSNVSICKGTCTTLNASATGGTSPYTYLWSNAVATASNLVCPVATTTYKVTVTDFNGCTATKSVKVTILTVTATITAAQTICPCSSTSINATGGGTYAWSTGATTSSIVVSPAATTTYTVTVTNTAGCTTVKSSKVTISCSIPSGLSASFGSSVVFNWVQTCQSIGYILQWRCAGTASWTSVNLAGTATSYTLPSLPACNSIEWRLRSKCCNGSFSAFANGPTVTQGFGGNISESRAKHSAEKDENTIFTTLTILPNPVGNELEVILGNYSGEAQLTITDMTGKIMDHIYLNHDYSKTLDVSRYPGGMYMVTAIIGNKKWNEKFVKL